MLHRFATALFAILLLPLCARADGPFPAHRIAGNTYYVGSDALATYLITTPDGHILINSGFEDTVPLIKDSVESLGFKMSDVKVLLESHAHSDHVEGHAKLQELTGAQVFVMRGDDDVIRNGGEGQYFYTDSRWTPCRVDRVLDDGDEVTLGGTTLTARRTPGHTRGCTTWVWQVEDNGKKLNVVVVGSPNVNPGFELVGNKTYPGMARDYATAFAIWKSLPCDLFLGAHGNYYGMHAKYERLKDSDTNPFVDPDGYKAYITERESAYLQKLSEQRAASGVSINEALKPFVEQEELAGAVALVADRDGILSHTGIGMADIGKQEPMRPESMFWIASQSKPITGTALMLLVDEGRVSVDDPVEKYLPEFRGQMVAVERSDERIVLQRPAHPITVKNVLSHTSGLPFRSAIEVPTLDRLPLEDRVRSYAMTPLDFEPDSKYQYSNAGINTAARIIEVVTGQRFETFLDERLFQPLGMKDTTFYPTEEQAARIAKAYRPGPDKTGLEETTISQLQYPLSVHRDRYAMPAGGLFSTAHDLSRFYRMIANGGELDGRRYLSEASFHALTSRQTPEALPNSYGFGFSTGGDRIGHGGAYSTNSYFDQQNGLVFIWLVQHAGFPGKGGDAQEAFRQAALKQFGSDASR